MTWKGLAEGTVVWIHGGALPLAALGCIVRRHPLGEGHAMQGRASVVLARPGTSLSPAHEDVFAALAHWVDKGDSLVVMGDSAGGIWLLLAARLLRARHPNRALKGVALLSRGAICVPTPVGGAEPNRPQPFDNEDAMTCEAYLKDHNPRTRWFPTRGLRWPLARDLHGVGRGRVSCPDIKAWSEAMNRQGPNHGKGEPSAAWPATTGTCCPRRCGRRKRWVRGLGATRAPGPVQTH